MPRRIPNSTWAEIRTACASGIGLRELARNMSIPAGTVLARAKREAWTRQIQQAKALARPAEQSVAIGASVMQSVALSMAERGQRHIERMANLADGVMPHLQTLKPDEVLDRVEDIDRLDKLARRTYGLTDGAGPTAVLVNVNLLGLELQEVAPGHSVGTACGDLTAR